MLKNIQPTPTSNFSELESTKMLQALKSAYNSINALKKTPSHRKIALEVEKKIRQEQKAKK